jgi:two-component system response regulator DesR
MYDLGLNRVPLSSHQHPELPGASDSLRVVVVDDVADFREATCDLLHAFFDVELVGTGKDGFEALQLAVAYEPDLLLMDVNMPGLDGISAASLVSRFCPATKILIMSGEDTPEVRERCRLAGAHGFTSKHDLAGQFAELCGSAS